MRPTITAGRVAFVANGGARSSIRHFKRRHATCAASECCGGATDRHSDIAVGDSRTIELTLSDVPVAPDRGTDDQSRRNTKGDIAMMNAAKGRTPTLACPDLMAAMILALDIDVECLSRPWNRETVQFAVARCASCASRVACRQWLGGAHDGSAGYGDFCPNADLFDWFKCQSAYLD
jgi:uncharacterized protein DUF6455